MLSINLMKMMKNRKIKLLFFHTSLELGGGERILINILNHLDRSKFDIVLALLEKKGVFLTNVPKDIKIISIRKEEYLKNKSFFVRAFRYLKDFYDICKIVNSECPDIVLDITGQLTPKILFARLFRRKTKFITSVHIHISECNVEALSRLKINFFFDRLFIILLMRACRRADKVICVSKGVAIDINKNFSVSKDKIVVIYNPLNINEIDKLKNEEIYDDWFKNNNLKIISIGRLHALKGYEYLLKAFKLLRESGINANLIILGEGPERENLENLARNLGIDSHVILTGFKENPYKYMKNSDIFVLPSLSEAFGCAIIEAMACGIPVIATRCSGPVDIITKDVNGLLVPVKDEKALANAIINLIMDKEKAKKLSEEGIKRVKDFDVKKIVNEYEKVFVECYHNK